MSELYPLKFEPILKEKVWGGSNLVSRYHKKSTGSLHIGESWELSAIQENTSSLYTLINILNTQGLRFQKKRL